MVGSNAEYGRSLTHMNEVLSRNLCRNKLVVEAQRDHVVLLVRYLSQLNSEAVDQQYPFVAIYEGYLQLCYLSFPFTGSFRMTSSNLI